MGGKEFLTVAEYAEIKGITPQGVYKQLNTKLKEYLIEVDNQKYIKIEALTEEELNQFLNGLKTDKQPVEQQFLNFQQQFNNTVNTLFEEQLAEKDRIIANLFKQLEEKDRQLEKLYTITNQAQTLQAAEKQMLLESQKKKKGLLGLFGSGKHNLEQ